MWDVEPATANPERGSVAGCVWRHCDGAAEAHRTPRPTSPAPGLRRRCNVRFIALGGGSRRQLDGGRGVREVTSSVTGPRFPAGHVGASIRSRASQQHTDRREIIGREGVLWAFGGPSVVERKMPMGSRRPEWHFPPARCACTRFFRPRDHRLHRTKKVGVGGIVARAQFQAGMLRSRVGPVS